MGYVQTVSQCKVCNSYFRNLIEQLHLSGLSPEKIYDYMQNLSDPTERAYVLQEDIKPSSIRRHLKRHFNSDEGVKVKLAETRARIQRSRNLYQQGVQITIDKINSLNHLIEVAMINLEEVESQTNEKQRHQLTLQYMNVIKGLIESLSKLTGDLKQEGQIDINFFNNEITTFADIVLQTVRTIDRQLGMRGELEVLFAREFGTQWKNYRERQARIFAGELSPNQDEGVYRSVNTFNENV